MIYGYTITTGKGEELKLSDYKGKVILIVNTATGCGFTPQYAPIEKLYEDYHDLGLEILDIPCNQFGAQAPGTDEEIHEFCTMHFNTTFPQMKKADVNGENELPLYTYLKSQKGFEGFDEHPYKDLLENMFAQADPEWDKKPDIKWNFTKFVADRDGNIVARFEPTADMEKVEVCIKELLEKKKPYYNPHKNAPCCSAAVFGGRISQEAFSYSLSLLLFQITEDPAVEILVFFIHPVSAVRMNEQCTAGEAVMEFVRCLYTDDAVLFSADNVHRTPDVLQILSGIKGQNGFSIADEPAVVLRLSDPSQQRIDQAVLL